MNRLTAVIALCFAMPVLGQTTLPSVVAPNAKVEKISGEFKFTEGACSDKQGNVYFVDQDNNRIMKYDIDGKLTTFMQPSNYSNGMCFDNTGHLIACADEKNEMWSIDITTKAVKVILKDFEGKYFNAPNDVWVHPTSGRIYFTDPYYHRTWWKRGDRDASELPQSVYFLEPDSGKAVRLIGNVKQANGSTVALDAEHFRQPNGIIGTPDGKQIYVSDIAGGRTYVYDIKEDGALANGKLFCSAGSDGMTIDSEGNVYFSARSRPPGVTLFSKTGENLGVIPVAEAPANMCFGGKDMKTLFITARTGFYAVKTTVHGVGSQ
ncbi:MAG TPA: SMP-30/gluconolactonase/LRE family protein [Tepidisphaeraceae bacterium]|nr:SMP-30/gluconolactonase/LRE family protein [Tepidisphaeraceae bacterium]